MGLSPCGLGHNLMLANLRYDACCATGFYASAVGGTCAGIAADCGVDRFEPSIALLLGEHDVARPGDYGYPVSASSESTDPSSAHSPQTNASGVAGASGNATSGGAASGGGMLDVFA